MNTAQQQQLEAMELLQHLSRGDQQQATQTQAQPLPAALAAFAAGVPLSNDPQRRLMDMLRSAGGIPPGFLQPPPPPPLVDMQHLGLAQLGAAANTSDNNPLGASRYVHDEHCCQVVDTVCTYQHDSITHAAVGSSVCYTSGLHCFAVYHNTVLPTKQGS